MARVTGSRTGSDLVAFDDVIGHELADDAIRQLEVANVNRQVGEWEDRHQGSGE